MTQNKEILDKLITDNKDQNLSVSDQTPTWNDDEVLITVSRVVAVRYKFYIVVLLFLIFLVWYMYVLPGYDQNVSKKLDLSNLELQVLQFENKKNEYEINKWLVDKIQQLDKQIINCVNDLKWCNELPLIIQNDFGTVRSYVLLNEMDNQKMEIDEKAILANIDWFLIRRSKVWWQPSNVINGVLNKISIWDKKEFKDNLKFVPIELEVNFMDKEGLLSFIDNVEKKIPIDRNLRMLYKIEQISYDVVKSDEEQNVSIFMYLYFYEN